jgi:hypothetical protein
MKSKEQYNLEIHNYGKLFTWIALALMLIIPVIYFIATNSAPEWGKFGKAIPFILGYLVIGFIEAVSYAPLLGTGGQYLSFITGNIANLKLPCAINSQVVCKTAQGSEEQELVTTVSIAISSIVTTLIIIIGLIPLSLYKEQIIRALSPISPYVLPAIFGGLTVVLLARYLKIAGVPFLIMLALSLVMFGLRMDLGQSAMIPLGMVVAMVYAYFLYKKNKI